MSKKLIDQLTAALKKAGVEIKDDVAEAISETLGSSSLKAAGLVELGSGDIVVKESNYNALSEDLRKEKEKRREATTERDRLKDTLDAGDSDNKKRADKLQERNNVLEPRAEKLMKRARGDWESRAKGLPEAKADAKPEEKARVEKIRSRFAFAEKDKELTDDQVLENLAKHDELVELGVFEAKAPTNGKENPAAPPAPRGGGGGVQKSAKSEEEEALDWYRRTDPQLAQGNAR